MFPTSFPARFRWIAAALTVAALALGILGSLATVDVSDVYNPCAGRGIPSFAHDNHRDCSTTTTFVEHGPELQHRDALVIFLVVACGAALALARRPKPLVALVWSVTTLLAFLGVLFATARTHDVVSPGHSVQIVSSVPDLVAWATLAFVAILVATFIESVKAVARR